MNKVINIAIFASGSGSNAAVIIDHFNQVTEANITLVVSDNPNAHVLERAERAEIDSVIHSREDSNNGRILETLQQKQIDFIVLAGYLKKVGDDVLTAFPNRIVNIHPALLPKHGGKGMYGMNVHRAVVQAGDSESGPTIHYVNGQYDEGAIIEQFICKVEGSDTAEIVQQKVLKLEHEHYAPVIEQLLKEL